MSDDNLPVKSPEEFWADNEVMKLDALKDKQFLVAVSTGDRNKPRFLSNTVHGPYNFLEMVEQVGSMWQEHQHHAKVVLCEKNPRKALKCLDENTIDYIEAHFVEIVTEGMLQGAFDGEDKEYTCQAGIIEDDGENNPLLPKEEKKDDSLV